MKEKGMDAAELDLEDLPPKALRKLIKSLLACRGKPNTDKQAAESDKEREDLADLHEEKTGKTKGVPVEEDDLPFDLGEDSEEPDEASESDADDESQSSEPPKFKKRKGK